MATRSDPLQVGYLLGIFFISASSLLLEVCLTRLLAVTLWYHFTFMIISGGLLGFGAAAVVVSLWRRLRAAPLAPLLAGISATMALSAVGCFSVAQFIPLQPFSLMESSLQALYLALTYLLLTFPFFLAGLVVSLLLSRLVRSVTLLYALDLAGAGIGAVAALVLMSQLGGPKSLVLASTLAVAAALSFAWSLGPRARGAGLALLLLTAWVAWSADDWLPLRVSENKRLNQVATGLDRQSSAIVTRWSAIGRVDVIQPEGGEPRILIDGGVAATRVPRIEGDVERWSPPTEGMREVMALAPQDATVLIIGSGGGYEVASALALGAERVLAVEMNDAIVELVTGDLDDVTGGLFRDPRVEVHVDEGRSFVRRMTEPVDVIASVHTISNAAWASGALSLAENYTLTVEAMEDFLTRLSPNGILWLTRPEAQLPRLITTVRRALENNGIEDVSRHCIAYRRPSPGHAFLSGLIVSRRPLREEQVDSIDVLLRRDRLEPLLLPGQPPRGGNAPALRAALAEGPLPEYTRLLGELRPCTDEQPYFNQRLPWSALRFADLSQMLSRGRRGRIAMEEAPVAEVAVLAVLAWACLFSLILVLAPLFTFRRSGELDELSWYQLASFLVYFIALGLSYIFVEICLIQRLGLFVGRPEYALAVVLASMLVSSGAGSMVATRWRRAPRLGVLLALAVAIILINVHAFLGPTMTRSLLGLALASRMVVAAVLVAPLGFVMGMPLPLGLRAAPGEQERPHLLAWAFGLNCASSVIGSCLCVILSSSVGFAGALAVSGGIYVVAALAIRQFSR